MSPADQCNHCAAPIRWMITAAGKHMPVDAEPNPERGNVVRLGDGTVGVLNRQDAAAARATGAELYLHHAATCPHRKQWQPRRRRPANTGRRVQRRVP